MCLSIWEIITEGLDSATMVLSKESISYLSEPNECLVSQSHMHSYR